MREDVLSHLSGTGSRTVFTSCAMGSTPTCGIPPSRARRICARRAGCRPRQTDRRVRRTDHPAERRGAPGRGRAPFDPEVQLVLCAGAPTPPRSRPRSPKPCRTCRAPAAACSGCGRCCRSARSAKYSRLQQFSCARRCTNRWASSISRQWPARRPWSPPTWAAFQKWWPTGKPGCLVALRRGRPVRFRDAAGRRRQHARRRSGTERERFGRAGRQRCIDEFSWARIAEQTLEIYRKVSALA